MDDQGQPGNDWTVVLRRRPARIVAGRPEGGYTDAYEIICCDCGDHPDLDYRQVSSALQRIRGPYRLLAGVAAYEKHAGWHRGRPANQSSGRPVPDQHRMPGRLAAQDDPACAPTAGPAKNVARRSGQRHG